MSKRNSFQTTGNFLINIVQSILAPRYLRNVEKAFLKGMPPKKIFNKKYVTLEQNC